MPELPEVETTRRGIAPYVCGRRVRELVVRERRLRWPVAADLEARLAQQRIRAVDRRAKYLLFRLERGTLMLHLGMSGSLRVLNTWCPAGRHDHLDLVLDDGCLLRYTDPRRFGSLHWMPDDGAAHPLLAELGPEPLGPDFDGAYLHRRSRGRRGSVKAFIMDPRVVAGIGNIYACEALYLAGIRPDRPAGLVSRRHYGRLAQSIVTVLERALLAGGTTLRDFVGAGGQPGYFRQALHVYGRAGAPCPACGTAVRSARLAQRSTFFCPRCQR